MTDPSKHKPIRDLDINRCRVFFGNLPECMPEELATICFPYGSVVESVVQKNLGYVQFVTEESAMNAAAALMNYQFKGKFMTVRHICMKNTTCDTTRSTNQNASEAVNKAPLVFNDCEIIVTDKENTRYAEMIEQRLLRFKIRVDILYPNQNVTLGKVLSTIAERGCLYAILVTNKNEEHTSVTVNILYGQPAEHRNMPADDAIQLIATDYYTKILKRPIPAALLSRNSPKSAAVTTATATNRCVFPTEFYNLVKSITSKLKYDMTYYVPPLNEHHPHIIQSLLNLLANNLRLSIPQYDVIIKYLSERRSLQEKVESGHLSDISQSTDLKNSHLQKQKKILRALCKRFSTSRRSQPGITNLNAVKADKCLIKLLHDGRVQKSLDVLMNSRIGSYAESMIKLHRWIRH